MVIGELHRQPIGFFVRLVGDLHDLDVHAFKSGVLQSEVSQSLLLQPVLLVSTDREIEPKR